MKKILAILIILPLLLGIMACNDPKPVTDALHRAEAIEMTEGTAVLRRGCSYISEQQKTK